MARQPREWRTRARVTPGAVSTCALLPTCEATSLPDHGYLAANVAACHIQGMDASATAFHARNRSRISPGEEGRSPHRSKTSTANQAALAARQAASHGSRALRHLRTASAARTRTNSRL